MTTETLTPQQKEEQEFDAGFAEHAKAISTDTAPAPAPAPVDASAPAPAPAPAATAPAPAPAASAPAPTPAPAPAAPDTVEGLQAALRESQHRERSSAERISAFARKSNDLERSVAALNEKLTKLTAAPVAAPAPAPAAQPDEDDALTSAPDLEKAINKRVEKLMAPVVTKLAAAETRLLAVDESTAAVRQTLEPISRRTHNTAIAETFTELDKGFTPAWRETVLSPEFHEWLAARPKRTQDLYNDAVAPSDCAEVLDLFYAPRGGRPKSTAAPSPAPAPAPAAGDTSQERLRAAAGIPPSRNGNRPVAVAADDFEGAFAVATAAINAEKAQQRAAHQR